ncbi:hypothetical protein IM043_gp169 [Bacillus phage SPG24]|uniref:hypothetical protein n=1 Tax=Bacillus phage SPG24 TaxID=1497851 RepID=UPI0022BA156C|nr:hypothetical protein IM043_gp169 [Bacillus phage SPG24]
MTMDIQALLDKLEDMQDTRNDLRAQYEETGAAELLDAIEELDQDIEELHTDIEIMQENEPYAHMTTMQREMKLNGLSQADFI